MREEIAQGEITLRLNDSAAMMGLANAREQFRKTMAEIRREEATAKIDANIEPLKRSIRDAEARIKEFEARRAAATTEGERRSTAAVLRAARERAKADREALKGLEARRKAMEETARVEQRAARAEQAQARLRAAEDRNALKREQLSLRQQKLDAQRVLTASREELAVKKLQRQYAELDKQLEEASRARNKGGGEERARAHLLEEELKLRMAIARSELVGRNALPTGIKTAQDYKDMGRFRGPIAKLREDIGYKMSDVGSVLHNLGGTKVNLGPLNTSIRTLVIGTTAAMPLVTSLAGAIGSLIGVAGAGIGGAAAMGIGALGGLGMAFIGVRTTIRPLLNDYTQAFQAQKHYNDVISAYGANSKQATVAGTKFHNMLASMDPVGRKAFLTLHALHDQWINAVQPGAKKDLAVIINDGVTVLHKNMQMLEKQTLSTFHNLRGGAGTLLGNLSSGQGQGALAAMFGNFNKSLPAAFKGLGQIEQLVLRIGRDGSAYLPKLADAFSRMATRMNSISDPKLSSIVRTMVTDAFKLGGLLKIAVETLGRFFWQGQGAGGTIIDRWTKSLQNWNKELKSSAGQKSTQSWFKQSAQTFLQLGAALAPLAKGLGAIGAALQPILTPALDAVTWISKLVGSLLRLTALQGPLKALGIVLGGLWAVGKVHAMWGAVGTGISLLKAVAVRWGLVAAAANGAMVAETRAQLGGGVAGAAAGVERAAMGGAGAAAAGGAGAGLLRTAGSGLLSKAARFGLAADIFIGVSNGLDRGLATRGSALKKLTVGLQTAVSSAIPVLGTPATKRGGFTGAVINSLGMNPLTGLPVHLLSSMGLLGGNDMSKGQKSLQAFNAELHKIKGPLDQLPWQQLKHLYDWSHALGQDKSLPKQKTQIDAVTAALGALLSPFKKVQNDFKLTANSGGEYMNELKKTVGQTTADIKLRLGADTGAGKAALAHNFALAADAVRQSMSDGTISVRNGLAEIDKLMSQALSAMGISPGQAKRFIPKGQRGAFLKGPGSQTTGAGQNLGQSQINHASSQSGHARGGWVGSSNQVGRDSVPMALPEGWAVINRHQLAAMGLARGGMVRTVVAPGEYIAPPEEHAGLNELAHAHGYNGLGGLFSRVNKPHYLAKGGWVRTGATIDPPQAGNSSIGKQTANRGMSYAELEATPGFPNYSGGGIRRILGMGSGGTGLPMGFPLLVRKLGSRAAGWRIIKSDNGDGAGNAPHSTVDLHYGIARLLGGISKADIEIAPAGTARGAGVAGGAGGGPAAQIHRVIAKGVSGTLGSLAQGALDTVRHAANTRLSQLAPQSAGGSGGGGGSAPMAVPGGAPVRLARMIAFANQLAGMHVPYGPQGHSGWPINRSGEDCSSTVSKVLHAGGLLGTLDTTDTFSSSHPGFVAGKGRYVTVYDRPNQGSNSHMVMELNGRGYGTSHLHSGGGPGWGLAGGSYMSTFPMVVHPRGMAQGGFTDEHISGEHALSRTRRGAWLLGQGRVSKPEGFASGGVVSGLDSMASMSTALVYNPYKNTGTVQKVPSGRTKKPAKKTMGINPNNNAIEYHTAAEWHKIRVLYQHAHPRGKAGSKSSTNVNKMTGKIETHTGAEWHKINVKYAAWARKHPGGNKTTSDINPFTGKKESHPGWKWREIKLAWKLQQYQLKHTDPASLAKGAGGMFSRDDRAFAQANQMATDTQTPFQFAQREDALTHEDLTTPEGRAAQGVERAGERGFLEEQQRGHNSAAEAITHELSVVDRELGRLRAELHRKGTKHLRKVAINKRIKLLQQRRHRLVGQAHSAGISVRDDALQIKEFDDATAQELTPPVATNADEWMTPAERAQVVTLDSKLTQAQADTPNNIADDIAAAANIQSFWESEYAKAKATPGTPPAVLGDLASHVISARDQWHSIASSSGVDVNANQGATLSDARANLYRDMGSNFSPVGNTSSAQAADTATGQYASGSPRNAPGGGAHGPAQVHVTNHFAGPPPDPHTWSQGVGFELRSAV